ncbi:AB-hydrolase YheT [Lophium mytilinum]|uniref:alcohol O-acetyltransferase n=1 Tax=Lophium mytilinum TaxID=390894 RepID=A0A6A6QJK8_9PEZI|nr:AB-hydrolase YheT [Lophium mytilinum]
MVDFSWIYGHAKTTWAHPTTPIQLTTKSGDEVPLSEFCKDTIPECHLNPLLFNGHLQTCYTAIKAEGPALIYKRKIFESNDINYPGQFTVDFVARESSPKDVTLPERTTYYSEREIDQIGSLDSKPMIIALHGLSGGSHELYLRYAIAPLLTPEAGWEGCVINARGCSMSKLTTDRLFNARASWDVRQLVKWLRVKFPNRHLYGMGFSLGATILTNYVAEEGSSCELKAAVVISSPWNLEVSNIVLQSTWVGLNLYCRVLGGSVLKLFEIHSEQILKNPLIDEKKVRSVRFLYEFDRYIQGPTWGYPTEGAYYRDASSVDALNNVRIPLLAINAEDDPIACNEAIPYEEFKLNPFAVLCATSMGGHLGWFQIGGKRWFAQAVRFIEWRS